MRRGQGGSEAGALPPAPLCPLPPALPQAWRCGDAAVLTMERASRVCWSSGSGSREMCTHSGTFTVPPSRSAITTSSCKGGDRHERGPRGANGEGARPRGGPREPQLFSSPFSASPEHSGLQQQLSPTQETWGKLGLREQQGRKAGRRGKKRDAALLRRLGPRSWLCGIRLLSWLRGLTENTDTDASPSSSTAPLSPNGTSQLVREAAQKLVSVWIRLIML